MYEFKSRRSHHLLKFSIFFSFFEFLNNFLSPIFGNFKIILKKFLAPKIIDSYIYFKKNYYILKNCIVAFSGPCLVNLLYPPPKLALHMFLVPQTFSFSILSEEFFYHLLITYIQILLPATIAKIRTPGIAAICPYNFTRYPLVSNAHIYVIC